MLAAVVLVVGAAINGSQAQAQLPQPPRRPPNQQTPGSGPPAAPATPVRDTGGRPPTPSPGTSVLTGTVSSITGQPIAGARINVNGEGATRTTMTDARGRFSIGELRMGRYYLNVAKPGYITIAYGQRRVNSQGTAIPLGEGETRDLTMQLPRGSVLTGMVLDERGEPAVNASVRAMRMMSTGGERRPQPVGGDSTDDRGIFRIHSLQPGDYAVCAVQRNGAPQNDAQRVQSEIDMLRRSLENAPNAAARQQMTSRLADLERQLPAQAEPTTGYGTVCFPGSSPNAATTIPLAAGRSGRTSISSSS